MKYETPKMSVIELDVLDIIKTSTEEPVTPPGENDTPIVPFSALDAKF